MDDAVIFDKVRSLLSNSVPLLDADVLRNYVERFFSRRDVFLRAANEFGSPLYVIDEQAIINAGREFQSAFTDVLPRSKCFYALKSNDHPFVLKSLVEQGVHLDVSSGRELDLALAQNPQEIIFSGPGKTEVELRLACQYVDKVTILIDSFGELARLERVAREEGVVIKAGVRLMIEENGLWRKFGIPLRLLETFFQEASGCGHVDLCGLQFHASWNLDPFKQVNFLKRLGGVLANFSAGYLDKIRFMDIGGGYWPSLGEWTHPGATPDGRLRQCLEPQIVEGMDHRCFAATPLVDFVGQIRDAFTEFIFPQVEPEIYLEPGRWISNGSMHILIRVQDHKSDDVVITDGATSAVGWERYETDYCPVLNISRPSMDERHCMLFGSLCTPHDVWGYSYFGEGIATGDVLLIPDQGAYTYSLRQNFIKRLPATLILSGQDLRIWDESVI